MWRQSHQSAGAGVTQFTLGRMDAVLLSPCFFLTSDIKLHISLLTPFILNYLFLVWLFRVYTLPNDSQNNSTVVQQIMSSNPPKRFYRMMSAMETVLRLHAWIEACDCHRPALLGCHGLPARQWFSSDRFLVVLDNQWPRTAQCAQHDSRKTETR